MKALSESSLLVVCGSGGTGKTTVSAALGALAARRHGRTVLVLTVDPARRLADALGLREIGNAIVEVPMEDGSGRLFVGMIDTKASWDDLIERVAPNPTVKSLVLGNRLYRNLTSRFVHSHDYIAMERLYEAHSSGRWDLVVVDTPPSRNALDVLDAPDRMKEFFASRLLKLLTGTGQSRLWSLGSRPFFAVANRVLGARFLGDVTVFFSLLRQMEHGFVERANKVQAVLRSAGTSYAVVTTAEQAPSTEAAFLLRELRARGYQPPSVVVNRAIPRSLAAAAGRSVDVAAPAAEADLLAHGSSPEQASRLAARIAASAREMVEVARREAAVLDGFVSDAAAAEVAVAPLRAADVTDLASLVALGESLADVRA